MTTKYRGAVVLLSDDPLVRVARMLQRDAKRAWDDDSLMLGGYRIIVNDGSGVQADEGCDPAIYSLLMDRFGDLYRPKGGGV